MNALRYIPFFAFLLIIYNVLAFIGAQESALKVVLFSADLMSGATFMLSVENLLIIIGIFGLYFEIFKSTKGTTSSIVDHVLSMLVFVAFLIEFITVKAVGNASFLILMLMSMTDVIAGFTVSLSSARRDIMVER